MQRIAVSGLLAAALCVAWGCSKSEENAAAPAAPAAPQVPPHTVVFQFLEAVRTGNDKGAETMLTELARKKTQEMDLMVAPPGSPTAKFEVGATEVAEQGQLAYVESRWTDVGPDGKQEVNDFVWALRQDGGAWRIGGVATQPYPNMPFLQLDFENPEDMIKQTQMAEQEYQRRLNGGQVAGAPGATAAPGTTVAAPPAGGLAPTSGVMPALTPTPGALTSGVPANPVQNAGGDFAPPSGAGVQPVSGFSSGMNAPPPAALQAQQPGEPPLQQR
ncbi:MAG: hypothetical protein QM775_06410 [Pirellulales bacterium]